MIWQHATKKNPCPICGREDWCSFGERMMLCQRVESARPHSKGGWFHGYPGSDGNFKVTKFIPPTRSAPQVLDAESVMDSVSGAGDIKSLSESLGVSMDSLDALAVGYSHAHKAWAFPMSDGDGKYIGIRLRNKDGQKWAVTGSRQGVFLPKSNFKVTPKVCYLPEGPTDTAALLSMGLFSIGRPTCMSGNELVAQALKRLKIYKAVIISDNDGLKQFANKESRPGIIGAKKLKKELGINSVIWMPPAPIKDVREFYKRGGTAQQIENEIKSKVWSKI